MSPASDILNFRCPRNVKQGVVLSPTIWSKDNLNVCIGGPVVMCLREFWLLDGVSINEKSRGRSWVSEERQHLAAR